MSKKAVVRMLPKLGNPPVFAYRDEILRPLAVDWESDDPYGARGTGDGHPLILVDMDTGKDVAMFVWEAYRAPARIDWADVARRFFGAVATGDFAAGEMRVLMALFGMIGFGNAAVIDRAKLAPLCGMSSAAAVGKALVELERKGAVVKVRAKRVTRYAYRLNANLGATSGSRLGSSSPNHQPIAREASA